MQTEDEQAQYAPAPSPVVGVAEGLLPVKRLAEIAAQLDVPRGRNSYVTDYGVAADVVEELMGHVTALTTQLAEAPKLDNAAEAHYLKEVHETLPVPMSDFLHELHRRWAAQLAQAKEVIREDVKAEEMFKVAIDQRDARAAALLARAEKAEAEAQRLAARLQEEEATTADQAREKLEMVKALKRAEDALENCYDVTDYPADGESTQDVALRAVKAALSGVLSSPAPQPVGEEGGEVGNGPME